MSRLATFWRGLRSMRLFIGRRLPTPPRGNRSLKEWVAIRQEWSVYDESFWAFGPIYRSAPGGHFHFMFFALLNRKIGFYDTN